MGPYIKFNRSMKHAHSVGGFGIEVLFPGLPLKAGDSGIGAIGRIDQAHIKPGTIVPMHPHKDDEILTYLREGKLIHRDTIGDVQEISPRRLMLMNAGHSFQHEEVAQSGGPPLEALQIFIRPRAADLEPQVQFHDFRTAYSENDWRLIAGPSEAPLILRAEAWVHDARLSAGSSLDLPAVPVPGAARLLYVFGGQLEMDGVPLLTGEGLFVGDAFCSVLAHRQSDLVLFTTDLSAPVFKGGMFSGNRLSAA